MASIIDITKKEIKSYDEIRIGTYHINELPSMFKNIITKLTKLEKLYKNELISINIYNGSLFIETVRLETDEEYSLRIKQIPIKDKIDKLNEKGIYSLRELTDAELTSLLEGRANEKR